MSVTKIATGVVIGGLILMAIIGTIDYVNSSEQRARIERESRQWQEYIDALPKAPPPPGWVRP